MEKNNSNKKIKNRTTYTFNKLKKYKIKRLIYI